MVRGGLREDFRELVPLTLERLTEAPVEPPVGRPCRPEGASGRGFVIANRVSDLGKPPNHLVAAGASRVRSTAAPFSLVRVMGRPSDAPDQLIGMPFNS